MCFLLCAEFAILRCTSWSDRASIWTPQGDADGTYSQSIKVRSRVSKSRPHTTPKLVTLIFVIHHPCMFSFFLLAKQLPLAGYLNPSNTDHSHFPNRRKRLEGTAASEWHLPLSTFSSLSISRRRLRHYLRYYYKSTSPRKSILAFPALLSHAWEPSFNLLPFHPSYR